jgi:hypothetical protein
VVGDAVHYFVVHAGAGRGWKFRLTLVLMRIVHEQRLGAAELKMFGNDGVDIGSGHARGDNLAHELVRLPHTDACMAHQANFAVGFKLNHGVLRAAK